ncbi:MAG: hypothetical protein LBH52_01915 [Puniceicoccales bacterium]|jgi:predicted histidine transporter YuiF (NhaC family)|nr:hypothetical protein [Puniceicoccales bacterium]
MKTILLSPVILSIGLLCVLCLRRVNVLLAILISALVAGLLSGMQITRIMDAFIAGMGDNSETALSYILLGTFAASMIHTGFSKMLSETVTRVVKNRTYGLFGILTLVAIASQNIVPIHIAFIPMMIPPLLKTMNQLKIDRRAVACILAFGLKMPYIAIPAGFGIIFQNLIADNMIQNGMPVQRSAIWQSTFILGIAMTVGLCIAVFISYRKPRVYSNVGNLEEQEYGMPPLQMNKSHYIILLAILVTFIIQLLTHSLPLGALVGLSIIFLLKAVKYNTMDQLMSEGIYMMGFVAFVMLAAAGFANVLKMTGGIVTLVTTLTNFLPESKLLTAFVILLIGLLITMGIGTSFGTIPILATVFVPICIKMHFSPQQTIVLMAAASALGDAGSPTSDTTLGPTSGLNADGQHHHIYDTCIPTFLHYNLSLILFALMGVVLL